MTYLLKQTCKRGLAGLLMSACIIASAQATQWLPFSDMPGMYVDIDSLHVGQSPSGDVVAGVWYRSKFVDQDNPSVAYMDTLVLTNCSQSLIKVGDIRKSDATGELLSELSTTADFANLQSNQPFTFFDPNQNASDSDYANMMRAQCTLIDKLNTVMQQSDVALIN